MKSDRLSQIENSLRRQYKQLANKQQALDVAPLEDKERVRQQIKILKEQDIQPLEAEHEQLLNRAAERLQISEHEAEIVITELVEGVHYLETQPTSPQLEEILDILRELRDKANEPGKSATLKVKGMISTFPPFVGLSIEPEIDTENFWRQRFPVFMQLLKGTAKK